MIALRLQIIFDMFNGDRLLERAPLAMPVVVSFYAMLACMSVQSSSEPTTQLLNMNHTYACTSTMHLHTRVNRSAGIKSASEHDPRNFQRAPQSGSNWLMIRQMSSPRTPTVRNLAEDTCSVGGGFACSPQGWQSAT